MSEGLPQSDLDLLIRWYAEAGQRLRQIILHPKGLTQASQDYRQAWAAQRIAQVDRILEDLNRKALTWTGKTMSKAYQKGIATALQQAVEAGVSGKGSLFEGAFTTIDQRTLTLLAQDVAGDLSKATRGMAETARSVLRQTAQIGLSEGDINKILAGGVIEGTPRETIRALKIELERVHTGGTVKVIGKGGPEFHFEPGYYAKMVTVTKTREATVKARHQRLEDLGLDLVYIVGRRSKNFCSAYLGKVYSISGKHPKYPPLSDLQGNGPPFHPNCSKSTAPFVEELASQTQLDVAQGIPDAEQLHGLSQSEAQRRFNDLQIYSQIKDTYGKLTPISDRRKAS